MLSCSSTRTHGRSDSLFLKTYPMAARICYALARIGYNEGMERKLYPSDVNDDEWAFAALYLTLITEAAPQREYPLREVFNGLRWMIRKGASWRMMPHALLPWHAVYD